MTDEELLESLDRHFMAGCPSLSTLQLEAHKKYGSCRACRIYAESAAQAAQKVSQS